MVYRIYVEKKNGFDGEAQAYLGEIRSLLGISSVTTLRLLNRYDVEGISEELFERCISTVFSEPQVDEVTFALPQGEVVFGVEYLPGQFDQRADSAGECVQLLSQGERPQVANARIFVLGGRITPEELDRIKKYLINPVEAREANLSEKATLETVYPTPAPVEVLEGFLTLREEGLRNFLRERGLAMDEDDLRFCQDYFKAEGRDPTLTEIKVIDTYWSDHCRHTTFGTRLTEVTIEDRRVAAAYERYLGLRKELYGEREKPVCLMDLATIGAKKLKAEGILKNLDESDEINACTVTCKVDEDGEEKDWLLLFKNETHNHPTEIEPFGGAATCIGGAIRDPLSGRAYVYQAMRVTGAGNPLEPVEQTLTGKLPQRKIVASAAAGYSSYGNQIGLATGQVDELYHPGYVAKRMEIGAVIGAAPAGNVRREVPAAGDAVVLLGGRTGRDGCGGATGSSKAHKLESLESCGAEVQKGNAPMERKLQRLFRDPEAARLIKRCNDFGAGGVSVAIGELADGLAVDLDKVPKKYSGLDGTELAISESQERMAVVLSPEDVKRFLELAQGENLEATVVARVTEEPRLRMDWNGETIVNLSRAFLSSNGAPKTASVRVLQAESFTPEGQGTAFARRLEGLLAGLNSACKKGLSERFDSTVGAGTVLMPFGGKYQLTPALAMAAKLPVLHGETETCSGMAWGFNPWLMENDPYTGSYLAVVESLSKLTAAGFDARGAYLTFQEYFEKLGREPARWGKPLAALLGALDAQLDLGVGAIGGKDSMSGSFESLDVPPTLVSFAVALGKTGEVLSPEFKQTGSRLALLRPERRDGGLLPDPESLKAVFRQVGELRRKGLIRAVSTAGHGGLAAALFHMCLGNGIGAALSGGVGEEELFAPLYGSFLLELPADCEAGETLGYTTEEYVLSAFGQKMDLHALQKTWETVFSKFMPFQGREEESAGAPLSYHTEKRISPLKKVARPRALIPVFPGTNCEYDTARALERAGAEPEIFVLNNLTPQGVAESCRALGEKIGRSQMVVLPGGFSGGDEPDGSAKFITSFFRSPAVSDAVSDLLVRREGLMLGICNGFQALVKLGLLPYGEIREMDQNCPTLTFNTIGRHQSMLVNTRISSNLSPWLSRCAVGESYTVAVSHGEGRFVAPQEMMDTLVKNGQIAAQYVDLMGIPSLDLRYNPNGSLLAIEAITSPDGRVLGKMGHTERSGRDLYQNVPGNKYQPLFEGGVDYFR